MNIEILMDWQYKIEFWNGLKCSASIDRKNPINHIKFRRFDRNQKFRSAELIKSWLEKWIRKLESALLERRQLNYHCQKCAFYSGIKLTANLSWNIGAHGLGFSLYVVKAYIFTYSKTPEKSKDRKETIKIYKSYFNRNFHKIQRKARNFGNFKELLIKGSRINIMFSRDVFNWCFK